MNWLFVYLAGEDWKRPDPAKLDRVNPDGSYIGGTIISLLRVMNELHRRGHRVDLDQPVLARYDVLVICREPSFIADYLGVAADRRILWLHDIDQQADFRRYRHHYDGAITVSPFLGGLYPNPGIPLLTSTNPVEAVDIPREEPGYLSLCFAGMFIAGRGVDFALEVLAALSPMRPDARLHLYGSHALWGNPADIARLHCDRHYLPRVEAALAKVDGDAVEFHGNVANRELLRLLAGHHFLLIPADVDESCSMVAIEAQAVGTVVLASPRGALPDTVGPGGLCLPLEPALWAERIAELAADREAWQGYSRAGRAHCQARFRCDRVIDAWLEWLGGLR